ncbi:MAG: hypothetical protein ABIN10_01685 [Specibacter sp.]
MTVQTGIGPATVLHQLALGLECFDATTGAPLSSPVRAGREVPAPARRPAAQGWPCSDLEASAMGRFKLRYGPSVPSAMTLRLDDPQRRHVPRRFSVHLWPLAAVSPTAAGPYIPVTSRLLRVWLWPGSAYTFPRGTTLVRGRVARNGVPVRWARVTAVGPTGTLAGRAHADDRGEFLLVVVNPGQNPLEDSVVLDLVAMAPAVARTPEAGDNASDLAVEDVPRSSAPPRPQDLDNAMLRGVSPPAGYVPSLAHAQHSVPIGAELVLHQDVPFNP